MTAQRPPRRVRVTSPRARAGRRRPTTITREIDAQTQIGEVYMRSLIRTQLRLALLVLSAVGLLLAGLPLLFVAVPELPQLRLFGLPLPWLLLGVLVHPTLVAAAWFYCRQAERTERDFAELVEPKPPPGAAGPAAEPPAEPAAAAAQPDQPHPQPGPTPPPSPAPPPVSTSPRPNPGQRQP